MSIQSRWRIAGSGALICAVVMAWYGVNHGFMTETVSEFLVYWGLLLLCLVVCFVSVMLDIRFIRLRYVLERRELYRQVLGDEDFRKTLLAAQENKEKRD